MIEIMIMIMIMIMIIITIFDNNYVSKEVPKENRLTKVIPFSAEIVSIFILTAIR